MTIRTLSLKNVHPSWQTHIAAALEKMNAAYLNSLAANPNWLPGEDNVFNAFSIPLDQVNYVLFGESPYPRAHSANGFAFWDNDVKNIWSASGLDKKVNRATSLRNIIKMLLVADGKLTKSDTTQTSIAKLDKSNYVQTNEAFFTNFLNKGFLLLNASLALDKGRSPRIDAKAWLPFIEEIIHQLLLAKPDVEFILFGKIANTIDTILPSHGVKKLYAEHPYNLSFIQNENVLTFFKKLDMLKK